MWLGLVIASLTLSGRADAEAETIVFLNGKPYPVSFNDGDSFRVLEGPLTGTKARLAGFNTLESFGPVHWWGGWHGKELYAIAKMATYNARRGVWHCESEDLHTDGYGRILWFCLDLAVDQVRHGFAHVYSIGGPGDPKIVAAQREAIRYRRGIWAKGVPTYIVTSTHSNDEGYHGKTYNRLINSVDGLSREWFHKDNYVECQKVCHEPKELSPGQALEVVEQLRQNERLRSKLAGIEDLYLVVAVNTFMQFGEAPFINDEETTALLTGTLSTMKGEGMLPEPSLQKGSCMVHVGFKRRYMHPKPKCLKW
jgi:endonuclease YncB( thermonuclease family)